MLTLSCIKKTRLFFTILVVGITQGSYAQPTEQFIKVIVAPIMLIGAIRPVKK